MTALPAVEDVLVARRREVRILLVLGRLEVLVADVEALSLGLFSELFISPALSDDVRPASDVNHVVVVVTVAVVTKLISHFRFYFIFATPILYAFSVHILLIILL